MAQGTVKWLHVSAIERAGMHGLNEGQTVSLNVVSDRRTRQVLGGKICAPSDRQRENHKLTAEVFH
jgi:hypothetical protein